MTEKLDKELERIKRDKMRKMLGNRTSGDQKHKHHSNPAGKVIDLTDETFMKYIEENRIAVIDCWAPWCGPCKMIAPLMEEFATEYEGKIKIGKVDVDNNQNIAVQFGIRSIPTVLFFKKGKVVDRVIGAYPKSHFQEKIDNLI